MENQARTTTNADAAHIDRLVEEYARRVQQGDSISVEEFAAQHSDVAAELQELLPALVALERIASRTENDSPRTPEQIGPYVIRGVLGQGGMGIVYRAVQPSLVREVALKVLPLAQVSSPQARAVRSRRESDRETPTRKHRSSV